MSHLSLRRVLRRSRRTFVHTLSVVIAVIVLRALRPSTNTTYPPECFCETENFCMEPLPLQPTLQSKHFNCTLYSHLERFHLSEWWTGERIARRDGVEMPLDVDFVTASSANYFNLSRGLVKHLRLNFPTNRLVYYDLGLADDQAKEVKTWCKVEYRRFQFDRYPEHVRTLENYAWRVLVIAEQYSANRTFIYADAGVRLTEFFDPGQVYKLVRNELIEPYVMFRPTSHSIYATTAPAFHEYFPLPGMISKYYREEAASIQLVVPVDYTRQLLKWTVLCTLTHDCIAPPGHQAECNQTEDDNYFTYQGCHRYDQSLFGTSTARMLFGRDAFASEFNYATHRQIHDLDDIKYALSVRKGRYFAVNKMVYTNRFDQINTPLISDCSACQSAQQMAPFIQFQGQLLMR